MLHIQPEFSSPTPPPRSHQIMVLTPEQQQQPTWPAASNAPPPVLHGRAKACLPPSLFNSPSGPPPFGLNVTRNPLMDPMSPEHLALVVDTLEKHRILEVKALRLLLVAHAATIQLMIPSNPFTVTGSPRTRPVGAYCGTPGCTPKSRAQGHYSALHPRASVWIGLGSHEELVPPTGPIFMDHRRT